MSDSDPRPPHPSVPPSAPGTQKSEPFPYDGIVTLRSIPAEVDPSWWRRHAHLVRNQRGSSVLQFRSGFAVASPPALASPPDPEADAFAGLLEQAERVDRLRTSARGCQRLNGRLPHVLLEDLTGTSKRALARGIAAVARVPFLEVSARRMAGRAGWLRAVAAVGDGGVLFLDDLHSARRFVIGDLLVLTDDLPLALELSDGVLYRRITLRLPSLTLVAATSNADALSRQLWGRFGLRETIHPSERPEATRAAFRSSTDAPSRSGRPVGGAAPSRPGGAGSLDVSEPRPVPPRRPGGAEPIAPSNLGASLEASALKSLAGLDRALAAWRRAFPGLSDRGVALDDLAPSSAVSAPVSAPSRSGDGPDGAPNVRREPPDAHRDG